jgi:hypothetical protein
VGKLSHAKIHTFHNETKSMNTPDNLVPRVANLENLMQYMAETQRQLASNIGVLTTVLQKQDERIAHNEEEIQIMRQMLKNYDETILVMQGQIGLLLNKLLGNS